MNYEKKIYGFALVSSDLLCRDVVSKRMMYDVLYNTSVIYESGIVGSLGLIMISIRKWGEYFELGNIDKIEVTSRILEEL